MQTNKSAPITPGSVPPHPLTTARAPPGTPLEDMTDVQLTTCFQDYYEHQRESSKKREDDLLKDYDRFEAMLKEENRRLAADPKKNAKKILENYEKLGENYGRVTTGVRIEADYQHQLTLSLFAMVQNIMEERAQIAEADAGAGQGSCNSEQD